MLSLNRCAWCTPDPDYIRYHDEEWGVPVHDDTQLFEMLILEGAQAGLSWLTILKRRPGYRAAFDAFDARKIADYDEVKVAQLLSDPGIIRNRLKVAAAIQNARVFLAVQAEFGSFDRFIWQFVGGEPRVNSPLTVQEIQPSTVISDAMSKELKKRGFKFVGSTICYAFMQAVGMVDDHTQNCFKGQSICRTQI